MRRSWLTAVIALGVAGCYLRITLRTSIAPDGRTERRVSVEGPGEHPLAKEATSPFALDVAKEFEVPEAGPWSTREVGPHGYTVRGTFKNPAAMPSGYARRVEATGEAAPSRIEWRQKDRVFYTLYEYRETITDVVTADRFDSAANRLIDLGIDLACHVLEEHLGDTYDVARVTAHLRRDARPALKSLGWAFYENGFELFRDAPTVRRVVNPILRRHGIQVDAADFAGDIDETRERKLLTAMLGDRVRLKKAKDRPLNEEERKQLGDLLLSDAVQASAEGFLKKRLGEEEVQQAFAGKMWVSLFGAYGLMGPIYRFRASLLMPGQVVGTSGYLLGPSEVAWYFTGAEVYPRGYVMSATSVIFHPEAQRRVAKAPFVTSARQVTMFEWCLKGLDEDGQESIRKALKECVKRRSLEPLDKLDRDEEMPARLTALGIILVDPVGLRARAACIKHFIVSGGKGPD